MIITNKHIALIHIAKSKTGMSEDAYRELLAGFGVTSSRELTRADFNAIMRHFKKLGFVSTSKQVNSKQLLLSKIDAIRAELNLPAAYVDGMARNMFKAASYRWLNAGQLRRVVAALTYHQKRRHRG